MSPKMHHPLLRLSALSLLVSGLLMAFCLLLPTRASAQSLTSSSALDNTTFRDGTGIAQRANISTVTSEMGTSASGSTIKSGGAHVATNTVSCSRYKGESSLPITKIVKVVLIIYYGHAQEDKSSLGNWSQHCD